MSRTALITGAAGGIGRVVAERFVADGYRVAGADLAAPEVPGVSPYRADVSRADDVAGLVRAVAADHGGIEVLVTCAGLTEGAPLHRTGEEDWRRVLDANLTSVFLCVREVLPQMMASGGGRVVMIGSVLHRTAAPGLPAYAASKAAIAALGRQLSVDYGRHGVSFVTVAPGWVRTPATESRLGTGDDESRLRESNPMGLLGTPEEVAAAVAYAASPEAALLTGSELVLDAGASVVSAASLLRDEHRERMGLPPLRHA
ncbi:SDR family oxidoreductase [Streptomyces sp. L2]|uniref:SDR family NAD(P)-dependent oxidoreductase n=1 Tax=Streptomyces sp. L2 TaxID=2162665 RepID=UPI001011D52C|nr:SDR family oxidoreductase [Streptomyces sp. L2]